MENASYGHTQTRWAVAEEACYSARQFSVRD